MRSVFYLLLFGFGIILPIYAQYLPPEIAFQTKVVQLSQDKLDVQFKIAKGYAIYQDKVQISIANGSSAKVGKAQLPEAIMEHNNIIGDYYVYKNTADIIVPILDKGDGKLSLNISYQGCKGLEYCYPVIDETKTVILSDIKNSVKTGSARTDSQDIVIQNQQGLLSQIKDLFNATNSKSVADFFNNSFWLIVISFFCVGILLAATPCVFPMLPILFITVVGQNVGVKKSVILSSSYVLGMASAYALVGVTFAIFGSNLQIVLQNSIINYILAAIFIIFSLPLFGLFDIRIPVVLQNRLLQHKAKLNNIINTYITGVLSVIVLSPCVTAPLAGSLLYIASTGDISLGAIALFAMGIGSGFPLLLIAVFGNKILPKSGNWLLVIKDMLGFLMVGMGIYLGTRAETIKTTILCFAAILAISGTYFLLAKKYFNFKHRSILALFSILLILFSGYMFGYSITTDKVVVNNIQEASNQYHVSSIVVNNLVSLNKQLNIAKTQNKPVILDFTASWCIACKELAVRTFKNKDALESLKRFQVIDVDITNNDKNAKDLMKRYNVMAPPSLIFIDKNGNEVSDKRVFGFISSEKLALILKSL
ncbi:MAG: protein-disulfide reductase DsbD [Neisseriaceae bacterium]